MLHIVKLLEHRYPKHSGRILGSLFALSAAAMLVGIGLLVWK